MKKIKYISSVLAVSILSSVAGFLLQYGAPNEMTYLSSNFEVIEQGVCWGLFAGLFFIPKFNKYAEIDLYKEQPIKIWIWFSVAAVIGFVCNPIFYHISQIA